MGLMLGRTPDTGLRSDAGRRTDLVIHTDTAVIRPGEDIAPVDCSNLENTQTSAMYAVAFAQKLAIRFLACLRLRSKMRLLVATREIVGVLLYVRLQF